MIDKNKGVILITGACGRIGSSLIKALGSQYNLVGFELLQAFYASANEELVPCDLASDESVQQALTHVRDFYGSHITCVIHLAAYYSFVNKNSPLYDKITVEGTRRLLKGLQNFTVEQFIFSSTMLVHAPCLPGEKIDEEWPLSGNWGYPESKIKTEEVIHKERGKIPCVNLRIAGVYDDHCHSIPISNQIQRIYENQLNAHLFAGDISHGADFMHMDDLVSAIVKCIEKRKELGPEETFILGEGTTYSYAYLQKRISTLLFNKEIHTYAMPKPIAKVGAWAQGLIPFGEKSFIHPWMIDLADEHYELDIAKAKKMLGWQPSHSLDKTLPIMIADLKADPIAWYKKNELQIPKKMKNKGSGGCSCAH